MPDYESVPVGTLAELERLRVRLKYTRKPGKSVYAHMQRIIALKDELREYGAANENLREQLTTKKAELKRLNEHLDGYTDQVLKERRLADAAIKEDQGRIAKLEKAINLDISDAKAMCGGDGLGCKTFRKYYDSAQRRHQKCGQCYMDATFHIRDAMPEAGK